MQNLKVIIKSLLKFADQNVNNEAKEIHVNMEAAHAHLEKALFHIEHSNGLLMQSIEVPKDASFDDLYNIVDHLERANLLHQNKNVHACLELASLSMDKARKAGTLMTQEEADKKDQRIINPPKPLEQQTEEAKQTRATPHDANEEPATVEEWLAHAQNMKGEEVLSAQEEANVRASFAQFAASDVGKAAIAAAANKKKVPAKVVAKAAAPRKRAPRKRVNSKQ